MSFKELTVQPVLRKFTVLQKTVQQRLLPSTPLSLSDISFLSLQTYFTEIYFLYSFFGFCGVVCGVMDNTGSLLQC